MDETASILHQNSESGTRYFLNGLPWKVLLIGLGLAGLTYLAVTGLGSRAPDVDDLDDTGKLTFPGDEGNPTWFQGFDATASATPDAITALVIHNTKINASDFSATLKVFQNLKSIEMTNITVFGDFNRVYLPMLNEFKLNIVIHPDEEVAQYKTKAKLKSLLFFDKLENQLWDLNDVSSLGVDVEIIADGSKVIVANANKKEVVLTMTYCEEILRNIKWSFTSLTLGNCSVSQSSIQTSVTSLLLGNVGLTSGSLSDVIQSLPELEELYGSVPNLSIDLQDLPTSLNFLCLSGIKLNVPPGVTAPNIKKITIGGDVLDFQIVQNFKNIFPNVETVGIFGISENVFELLDSLMSSNVATILVEYFPTKRVPPITLIERKVDQFLSQIGIPKGTANFLITLPEGAQPEDRVGTALSTEQSDFFRYTLMGWFKIDSYKKYLRVIEEGRTYARVGGRKFIDGVGGEIWPLVVPAG